MWRYVSINTLDLILTTSGSMLSFVIAIAYLCFRTSTAQRAITAVVSGIVISVVAWEIAVHWKPTPFSGDDNSFSAKDLAQRFKRRLMRMFN